MPGSVLADRLAVPRLDRRGWLLPAAGITHRPSPNADERPAGVAVSLLVLHNISLPPGQFGGPAIEQLFTNRLPPHDHPAFADLHPLRVSAHFLIRRDGHLCQFVSTWRRAWHAGVSRFGARERCNDFAIGIELEGTDFLPYTDAQYTRLAALTGRLRQCHPLRAVTGHEHIAPGRKTDPGPAFDWSRHAREAGWQHRQVFLQPQPTGLVSPRPRHYN